MSCPSRPVLTQSMSAIPVTSNSSSSIPTVPCRRQAAECGETIQIVVAGDCLWSCSRGIWRRLPVLFGGGKQLYAVLVKRLQTEHPELPLYKNLPALWPGLVLRRTAWGMSHQVAVRRDQAALGCCKNRAPTQEKNHVSVCARQKRVKWGHAAAKQWLTKSKMRAFSNPHVWLHLKHRFPFSCCLWQSGSTVLLQCQESR